MAADEVYGDNGVFRAGITKLGLGYVRPSCTHRIPAFPGGKRRPTGAHGARIDNFASYLPGRNPVPLSPHFHRGS